MSLLSSCISSALSLSLSLGATGCGHGGDATNDGVAMLGNVAMSFDRADVQVSTSQGTTTLTIAGETDPSCVASGDGVRIEVKLVVPRATAVPLGRTVVVGEPDAPFTVSMSADCPLCSGNDREPSFAITGWVRFDALTTTSASGALELHLLGDVPMPAIASDRAYPGVQSLDVTWVRFHAPSREGSCRDD